MQAPASYLHGCRAMRGSCNISMATRISLDAGYLYQPHMARGAQSIAVAVVELHLLVDVHFLRLVFDLQGGVMSGI